MNKWLTNRRRAAFTLVELLVVIAIIGVLVALLLPAVQAAREAARRMQCSNHLKQIGLGFQLHHDTYNACPTGGQGVDVARTYAGGSPATLVEQSWNWTYQILPYIEQGNLYSNTDDAVVKGTPMKIYFCPSRRPPQVWDINTGRPPPQGSIGRRAQIDYVGCRGSTNDGLDGIVVRSLTNPRRPIVRFETVTDGLSNTLVAGERSWPIDWYYAPGGPETDWYRGGYVSGFTGSRQTFLNLTGTSAPIKDPRGPFTGVSVPLLIARSFGSAHPGGINVVLGDGSVRTVSYTINLATWLDLARRDDGNALGDF
jgi:prepilin-type N-terminal cleavage/methylation domain-containing protein/prepilin-type processing-associated H-X9-DG protein